MASSGEDCCSGGCVLAGNFKLTDESWEEFLRHKVNQYWSSHDLPGLNSTVDWTVYIAKQRQWFKHHSVVMMYEPTGDAFTMELKVDMCSMKTYPESKYFDRSSLDMTKIGSCCKSAKQVFYCALKHLEEFGGYQGAVRNCQNYCKELAEKLTGSTAPPTDTDNAATIGGTAVAGVGLAGLAGGILGYALYKMFSGGKEDSNKSDSD